MHFLYCITNTVNDKKYFGITNNVNKRYIRHISNAKNCVKGHLYDSIRLYGRESFKIEIIEQDVNRAIICNLEISYIKSNCTTDRNFGYNKSTGGENGASGVKMPDAQKQHLSHYYKGKAFSEETRLKISQALTGRKHSKETLEKLSLSKKGKPRPGQKITAIHRTDNIEYTFKSNSDLCRFFKISKVTFEKYKNGKTVPRKNSKIYNFHNSWSIQWQ